MSGGGSASAGVTNEYAHVYHATWLTRADNLWKGSTGASYVDNSPYRLGYVSQRKAYDPDFYLDGMLAALNAYVATLTEFHTAGLEISDIAAAAVAIGTGISSWNSITKWEAFADAIDTKLTAKMLGATEINAEVDAISDILQDDVDVSIGKFKAGMRDINAVQSTSFTVGVALLQAAKDKQVAKIAADLALKGWEQKNQGIIELSRIGLDADYKVLAMRTEYTKLLMGFYTAGVDFKRKVTDSVVDTLRISIVAKKEETDKQIEIDAAHERWTWELCESAARLFAGGLGGSNSGSMAASKNPTASALGGALSGAGTGAMVGSAIGGPGIGTAVGAGIGAIVGGIAGML